MHISVAEGIKELDALADELHPGAKVVWLAMAALADERGVVKLSDSELAQTVGIKLERLEPIILSLDYFGLITVGLDGYHLWPWVPVEEGDEEEGNAALSIRLPKWLPKRVLKEKPVWIPNQLWVEWEVHRKQLGKPLTDATRRRMWNVLNDFRRKGGVEYAIASIEQSLARGWRGFFEPKSVKVQEKRPTIPAPRELGRRTIQIYDGDIDGEGFLYAALVADMEGGYMRIVEEGDPVKVGVRKIGEAEASGGNLIDSIAGLIGGK